MTMQTLDARTWIGGRDVEYRVRISKSAQRLRIRVGIDGIEVVQPLSRETAKAEAFLQANASWVAQQLDRVERMRPVRRVQRRPGGEILLRGSPRAFGVRKFLDAAAATELKNATVPSL